MPETYLLRVLRRCSTPTMTLTTEVNGMGRQMVIETRPRPAERRAAVSFRLRADLAEFLRQEAETRGESQTVIVERALLRAFRDERRRLAQLGAREDAAENREFAAAALEVSGDLFAASEW